MDWNEPQFCYIDGNKLEVKPPGHRAKPNDSIFKTAKRIMAEAVPCDDCAQAASCKHECSLFSRYTGSKGKPWREIDKWKNEPVEVKCDGLSPRWERGNKR